MRREDLMERLAGLGIQGPDDYFSQAFCRNLGLLTEEEQERLRRARVAIPGLGGVGGSHLVTMTRSGVGGFNLADFDTFDPVNVNRQHGASVPSFGRPKVEVMAEEALGINPFLDIRTFPQGLEESSLDDFLEGVDVVLDGLDFFCLDIRRSLFKRARELGIPVVTAGPMGFSAALLVFTPGGMGFDEYFGFEDWMPLEEKALRFAMGLSPWPTHLAYLDRSRVCLRSGRGPSLGSAINLCAAVAATEAMRILLGRGGVMPAPHYLQFDPYRRILRQGRLSSGSRGLLQRLKLWYVRRMVLGAGPTVAEPARPEGAGPDRRISRQAIEHVMRAGLQAPSGDNAQPWRLARLDDGIDLILDEAADHSFFNVGQLASAIACGAAVENMVVAATALGIEAQVVELPQGETSPHLARLTLSPSDAGPDPLAGAIWERSTNRRPFRTAPPGAEVQNGLRQAVGSVPGARLHLLTGRARLARLARLVYKVDRIRTEHQGLHEHLMHMTRFEEREVYETRTGLPLPNLEAGPAGEAFLRATRDWAVMERANAVGLGRLVAVHSAVGILRSGGAGLVTVPGTTIRDFLRGGRGLERVWLTLTSAGLAMQPMTAATLFLMRWRLEGEEAFSPAHRALLGPVWREYQALFPEAWAEAGHVMLFRMGYGPATRYRTIRRDLEEVLLAG